MQFSSIFIVFALAKALVASPLSTRSSNEELFANDYLELWHEDAKYSDGKITYYGPSNSTLKAARAVDSAPAMIEGRAGCTTTATPSCHTSHSARNDVCDQLVNELQGDSQVSVGQSPRQICYEGSSESNEFCCVSWHNPVSGLVKGDLANYAYTSKSSNLAMSRSVMLIRSSLCNVHCKWHFGQNQQCQSS